MTPMLEDRSTDTAAERGALLHDEATRTIERFLRGERFEPFPEITGAFTRAIWLAGMRDSAGDIACALVWTWADKRIDETIRNRAHDALVEYEDDAIEALAERMGNP